MEHLFSVADICARYQVKPVTARKYIREMEHMENPLMVTERALRAWEHSRTVPGSEAIREIMKGGGKRGQLLRAGY